MNIFYWLFDKWMGPGRPMSWDQLGPDAQKYVEQELSTKGIWPAIEMLKGYGFTEENAISTIHSLKNRAYKK